MLRLLCFHHAGGSAASFHGWAEGLAGVAEPVPVELPGRLGQPPLPAAPLQDLVTVLAEDLGKHMRSPFALFGHSLGALVGFELCRELRRRSQPLPSLLVVSGHRAPHLPNFTAPMYDRDDEALLAVVSRLGMVPQEVRRDGELREMVLGVLRQDLRLAETYRCTPEAPLPCAIAAFGGRHDPRVSPEEIRIWAHQTSGAFTHHILDGGHFYLAERQEIIFAELRQLMLGAARAAQEPRWGAGG